MKMIDVKGYEGIYAVSEDGKVWVYPRHFKQGFFMKTQVNVNRKDRIKPFLDEYLKLEKDGIQKRHSVSRLVCSAFIKNSDNKPFVNHKDGDRLNNHISNLEWVTASENMKHSQDTGLSYFNSDKQKAARTRNGKKMGAITGKLTRRLFSFDEAIEIRKIAMSNLFSNRRIAIAYNCCSRVIDNIKNNQTYCTP